MILDQTCRQPDGRIRLAQGREINIDQLARGTTGFTGADIENMVNQAALR